MEIFGLLGFCLGTVGMTFGLFVMAQTHQLEAKLKASGVLKDEA